jgi:hypothetical protein
MLVSQVKLEFRYFELLSFEKIYKCLHLCRPNQHTSVNADVRHANYLRPLTLKSALYVLSIHLICFPRHLYRFHVELHDSLLDEAELLGHSIGDIHVPAVDIGSPVINNPFDGLAVIRVEKPNFGPQG